MRVFAELKNSVARRSEWEGGGTGQVERGTQSPRLPSFQYRWLPFDDRAENHISSLLQGGLQAATREGTQRASGEAGGSTRRLSRCQERGCSLGLKTWESEELTETQKVRFGHRAGALRLKVTPGLLCTLAGITWRSSNSDRSQPQSPAIGVLPASGAQEARGLGVGS